MDLDWNNRIVNYARMVFVVKLLLIINFKVSYFNFYVWENLLQITDAFIYVSLILKN